ncbi:MAG: AraC family transcriptional regulator [Bacteroidota bacterium]
MKMHREIVPLEASDSFLVFDRLKTNFDYPAHYHPEYEINCIFGGKGLMRQVGDTIEEIGDHELVLIGPNLVHGWHQNNLEKKEMHEITVQFHPNLFDAQLLDKSIMGPIKQLLLNGKCGIVFSKDTMIALRPRILELTRLSGMDYFLGSLSLLHDLAISRNQRLLSTTSMSQNKIEGEDRIQKVVDYVHENYKNPITLSEAAKVANMSEVSFNRFMKKCTNKTFVEYLNDIRIGYAVRHLIEDSYNISEIAYLSGFKSLANFNKTFKKVKGRTPSQYKKDFPRLGRVL